MKKILSMLLVAAMLVTTIVVVALPASAANGDWSVYTIKSQDLGVEAVQRDIPGYQYTTEGLKVIPGKWEGSSPYATVQTTSTWDLSSGIYLQVRVDDFSYDAGDSWFGFSFWDQQNVELGKQGEDYGYGVETLIRVRKGDAETKEEDKALPAGTMRDLEWYKDLTEGQRVECEQKNSEREKYENNFDENGKPIITIEVKWDSANEGCTVFVNGSPAPDSYNQALNDYFEEDGYYAYVGFSLQNSKLGGTVACTVLKFGTSEATATVPQGDDSREPDIRSNEYAELADSSSVAANKPAVMLNGSSISSQVAGKPTSVYGNRITVNDDDSINVLANSGNQAFVTYRVANEVSYKVNDFPIVLIITRNLCTCTYTDINYDGMPDPICQCDEQISTYALAGDIVAEDSNYAAKSNQLALMETLKDKDGNEYLYFIVDWSEMTKDNTSAKYIEGRIHGIRIDVHNMKGSDAERNNFDICEVGFFRSIDEANAYFAEFNSTVINSGAEIPTSPEGSETGEATEPVAGETTEPVAGETTEPVAGETTEPVAGETTEPVAGETTEPVAGETTETIGASDTDKVTEPATTEKETNATVDVNVGCGGVVGVGAIAVVALAAAGLISFKKKED